MNITKYKTLERSAKDSLAVRFLYNTFLGRMILKVLVNPWLSKVVGKIMDSRFSSVFISGFIRSNNISLEEYKEEKYKTFNQFFTREIKDGKRLLSENCNEFLAPCDGKLSVYKITSESVFEIKNSFYDINSLLKDKKLADEYREGTCLIFRLTPDDYHRYCFVDDGKIISHKKIKGKLHTVRPIALNRYKVYIENSREYDVLETKNFGKIIQMEVGALLIGRIANKITEGEFKRGQAKGMFEFGGSTIIMLLKKDEVKILDEIFENTLNNKESVVRMGDKIGEK